MNDASLAQMAVEQDEHIAEVVTREQSRLRDFIRRRVPDPRDAEDVLRPLPLRDPRPLRPQGSGAEGGVTISTCIHRPHFDGEFGVDVYRLAAARRLM
jgi:hypothetical protein